MVVLNAKSLDYSWTSRGINKYMYDVEQRPDTGWDVLTNCDEEINRTGLVCYLVCLTVHHHGSFCLFLRGKSEIWRKRASERKRDLSPWETLGSLWWSKWSCDGAPLGKLKWCLEVNGHWLRDERGQLWKCKWRRRHLNIHTQTMCEETQEQKQKNMEQLSDRLTAALMLSMFTSFTQTTFDFYNTNSVPVKNEWFQSRFEIHTGIGTVLLLLNETTQIKFC